MSGIDVDKTVRDLAAGELPATPCLLLTTVGRRSGGRRTMPLIYGSADGHYIIIGSKGGADAQPARYLNLLKDPTVEFMGGARST
jgi:deazaflavin-dependent oxidoreductase (nitroreductase family)